MKTFTRQEIIALAPRGTWGRILDLDGDVFGVAANWANASDTVAVWSPTGEWLATGYQVAHFRHSPAEALRRFVCEYGYRTRRIGRRFIADK